MDQWTNGPMDQWTNGPMDQSTNGQVDQWTNGPVDPMDQLTNGPMDQWTNGQETLATLLKDKHIGTMDHWDIGTRVAKCQFFYTEQNP